MILTEIAPKYSTDKNEHGYMPHYFKHLPDEVNSLLEIGCLKGESLRMWREIYPNAELHTLDLFQENPEPTDIPNLTCWKGSQTNTKILERLKNKNFDVIIDDASHNSKDQILTFNFIYPNFKLYVIEDLHCCNDSFYRQGMPFRATILGQIKHGNFPYNCNMYDDKIVFIFPE